MSRMLKDAFKETIREGSNEYTTDDPSKIGTGGVKFDGGKPAVFRGFIGYFPRAVEAVAAVSTFGASKYAWKGWAEVEDGIARYTDAMCRHLIDEGVGECYDPDSELLHSAHVAWNALARLELMLKEKEDNAETPRT